MTVCVAAITLHNEIVTVSDTMLSTFMTSADMNTVKMDEFGPQWNALWAADDITQILPIIELAKKYFKGQANTLAAARLSLRKAYEQRAAELAAIEVLGPFGMDLRMFRNLKRKMFSERESKALMAELKKTQGRCIAEGNWNFLAFGFDEFKMAHLFTVTPPGRDSLHDKPGFHAIGSGGYAAESLLFHLGQSRVCPLAKTLINCLFAKFMAEKTGAGRHTFIFAKRFGSTMCAMPTWLEPDIRRIWEETVSPRVPDDLLNRVAQAVADGYIHLN
jgi:hypothetical protein